MKPVSQQPQPSAADRAPPAPFESLLDDSTQGPAQPDPQPKPAASTHAQRGARSEASKQASHSKDTKSAKAGGKAEGAKADKADKSAKGDTSGKSDKSDKSDATTDAAKAAETKNDGDAKTDAPAHAADALTAAGTGTSTAVAIALPAAAPLTSDPTQAIADDGAAAAVPVTAVAATLAPAITTTITAATKEAPAAESNKADAKVKPDLLAAQGDAEAPGADAKVVAKTARPHADGKPVDADDKQAAAPAPADSDRAIADARPAAGGSQAAVAKAGADAMQPPAINAPVQHAAASVSTAAAPATQLGQQLASQPVPLAGVAFEIASKAVGGKNHFEIRLDPPELGRIEVRLDVGRDGSISSHVIADRKDTLDLLQRDASGLQRAFEDAGLKTSDQGMQFSLRHHSAGQQQHMPNATTAQLVVEDETSIETQPVTYSRLAGSGGGLDIRV